jgi:hypothetical protein
MAPALSGLAFLSHGPMVRYSEAPRKPLERLLWPLPAAYLAYLPAKLRRPLLAGPYRAPPDRLRAPYGASQRRQACYKRAFHEVCFPKAYSERSCSSS